MSAQLNTQNADAQITLAWILYQLARNADAEQALRSGLQSGQSEPRQQLPGRQDFGRAESRRYSQATVNERTRTGEHGIFIYKKEAQTLLDSLK